MSRIHRWPGQSRISTVRRLAGALVALARVAFSPISRSAIVRVRGLITLIAAAAVLAIPFSALPVTKAVAGSDMAQPDMVTQWNLTMIAGLEATQTPPPPSARVGAIVQASVFDAV